MATDKDPAMETDAQDLPVGGAGEGSGTEKRSEGEDLLLSLQDARAKADDYWNQLLRLRAEMANQQRRAERELENAHKYGLEKFAAEMLPVIDGLEMGLNASAAGEGVDPVKLREGMELTLKILSASLEKFGVRALNPAGEKFNPAQHQAMAVQPASGAEPNTVLAVYQKGYLLNDRLMRPAMVVVSAAGGTGKPEGPAEKKIDELA
ncbi:MAG: nucleotide exchange factor GrpE [Gammaproteobacteria bacterium]|nr:nucleotide exchange factor GrpE [Gammaproteobacteria bacterium]